MKNIDDIFSGTMVPKVGKFAPKKCNSDYTNVDESFVCIAIGERWIKNEPVEY